jgi:hypothetical protein
LDCVEQGSSKCFLGFGSFIKACVLRAFGAPIFGPKAVWVRTAAEYRLDEFATKALGELPNEFICFHGYSPLRVLCGRCYSLNCESSRGSELVPGILSITQR